MATKSSIKKTQKKAQPKQSDRRSSKRVSINIWVREERDDYYFLYKATDISDGGIFLEKKIEAPNTTPRSTFKFTLPKSSRLICVDGDSVFTHTSTTSPRPGTGIKFVNLTNQDRKLLTKYLSQA